MRSLTRWVGEPVLEIVFRRTLLPKAPVSWSYALTRWIPCAQSEGRLQGEDSCWPLRSILTGPSADQAGTFSASFVCVKRAIDARLPRFSSVISESSTLMPNSS